MSSTQPCKKILGIPTRLLFRGGLALLLFIGLSWLAVWLLQRSLISSRNKRAVQSWLDDKLNADVSLGGSMVVRLNLIRKSRLVLHAVEVEHPNPLFSSKFATADSVGAWSPPWAVLRLWPGRLNLVFEKLKLTVEENDLGEWSCAGLMNPIASSEAIFPFPMPKISKWRATVNDGELLLARRGHQFKLRLDCEAVGRPGNDIVALSAGKLPFTYGTAGEGEKAPGILGPVALEARLASAPGEPPRPVPGKCEFAVENLPVRILPFVIPGIPLDGIAGVFNGSVALRETADADGSLHIEGELRDMPLAVFGLPRQAPIRLDWPLGPKEDGLKAAIRMGPSGYGAFAIDVPLDAEGKPKQLIMRGSVASLDDMPAMLSSQTVWPDWLSRTFPSLEWRAGRWLGFGWSGTEMQLSLTRTMAGLNLTGEAEMMGGRVRISLTPGQADSPITVSAERLDAQLLAVKLSQLLPEAFKTQLSGAYANLTWRGTYVGDNAVGPWGSGLVLAKPVLDLSNCGSWWKNLSGVTDAVIKALPEWGGGDASGLERLRGMTSIPMDQLSIVVEKDEDGNMLMEYRAYGDAMGQTTGIMAYFANGHCEGELYLAGDSDLLREATLANPELGRALELLASETLGLRVLFTMLPDCDPEFTFVFLEDAKKVRDALRGDAVETGDESVWEGGN